MGLLQESIAEVGDTLFERKKVEVDILKAHNALTLARVASNDRVFVFDKLRRKVKEAAKVVQEKKVKDVKEDMSEVGAVRQQAEALFGKFVPEEEGQQTQQVRSSQLSFLVGVRLDAQGVHVTGAGLSPVESPVKSGPVIDVQTDTAEPPTPSSTPEE